MGFVFASSTFRYLELLDNDFNKLFRDVIKHTAFHKSNGIKSIRFLEFGSGLNPTIWLSKRQEEGVPSGLIIVCVVGEE